MAPAYGAIYCHELAHVNVDECGAPELFTGGAKLVVMSGAGAKITHAVTRVFVTQGDRSGDQFNISFLLGGLLGAGVSNVWAREENQTVGRTFSRWGTHIGLTMLSNVVREFVGGQ